MTIDPQAAMMMLEHMLKPWHESVVQPAKAQEDVLHTLVSDYAKRSEEHTSELQ